MTFARKVWHLLVAIKDGLALLLLLLFFLALYAALTARPGPSSVREGALQLNLAGAIVEEPASQDPVQMLLSSQTPLREYAARDVIRGLRAAAGDARIKAVAIDLSGFTGAGQVTLHDVGAALDLVRAKKPVLVYAVLYSDDAIQLAAHASEVWVDPLGGAVVAGPGGTHLYYGPLLDRLKITPHVFRVGTYKAAVEPLIRADMSPEARQNEQALYGALWQNWKDEVARARPKIDMALATGDPAGLLRQSGGDGARAALAAGLADRIGDATDFAARVARIAGKDPASRRPDAYAHTGLDAWLASLPPENGGRAIGVITVAGLMTPGNAGPGTAAGERIARLLDDGLTKNYAALVVRIDSPGGAVTTGEQIRAAIARYKARGIPVVVSMGNMAASGGYWITTAADRVFAEPSTLTGSIGVFGVLPSFERALAGIGVTSDGVRTTPLSGQPDPAAGYSPQFNAMMQSGIEFTYARFLALVGKARGKTPQQVDTIAQGRVWDGGTARQIGLVDQFGSLDDALAYAATAAHLPADGWRAEYLARPEPTLARLARQLLTPSGDGDSGADQGRARDWAALAAARREAAVKRGLADMLTLTQASGMQAYCLTCPPPAGAATKGDGVARLGAIARLLALTSR